MGLMRSLGAGVSGLRNHQLFMDVIGNNIANVNTVGFKVGRVSFSEMFAQTLRGATQPLANQGGTNPIQVGLGMAVATVDTLFNQGSIESTGLATDLAIQGDGFFVLSDGNKRFYTRAGGFQFSPDGTLYMPSNGLTVQGFLANDEGVIPAGADITSISLPVNQKISARGTTQVQLGGNLDAALKPIGTILQTEKLFGIEEAGDDSAVEGLYAKGTANNTISGMIANSTTVTFTDTATGETRSYVYVGSDTSVGNDAFHSLDDLIAEVNDDFGAAGLNSFTAALNANGALELTDLSGASNTLSVTSTNSILNQALIGLNGDVNAGVLTSDEFSHVARSDDTLVNLRDKTGVSLGLLATDIITIDGTVGTSQVTQGSLTISAADTYQTLVDLVETTLGITNSEGVAINPNDGSMMLNGDGGTAYALSNIDLRATDGTGTTSRALFDGIFDATPGNYIEQQKAADAEQSSTITIYDTLGNSFDLTIIFTKDVLQPNSWRWRAQVPEPASVTSGGTGTVEFNPDGSMKRFDFDDQSTSVEIAPGSGASNAMKIQLNVGANGAFDGITQFSGVNSSTVSVSQDGYGMGILDRVNIDQFGQITGTFSNGIVKLLAQMVMAGFNNANGLQRLKGSLYDLSGNSGDPVLGTAGSSLNTTIVSGALEQSNVDLADEFTKMIVAQRGFQANARTITVSDDMLSEVTNLKR